MLTLQFIPYSDVAELGTGQKIKKILDIVKEEKIVILEGRLKKHEEAELIKSTMEKINDKFKGVEISEIYPDSRPDTFGRMLKDSIAGMLLGNRQGLTVIGPATLVREIKKDPDKIQLFTEDRRPRRKK